MNQAIKASPVKEQRDEKASGRPVLYDPPSGWLYGFPRAYQPLPGEKLTETLIRDGYPPKEAEFASSHCRFIGDREDLDRLFFDPGQVEAPQEETT